ncbi:hypothetical protein HPB50_017874 [Hyalomma asiaticum]|uniref:Uncharacterized protein n=1 Tax=Hyalomma asiaticum TaxID=266040 RepID=A0ACB7S7N3_HYAAI|nr:hypothetical protein HPB50_017874 [Hyalomma asiaticum]
MAPLMAPAEPRTWGCLGAAGGKGRELRVAQRGGLTSAASVVDGWPCPRCHRRVRFDWKTRQDCGALSTPKPERWRRGRCLSSSPPMERSHAPMHRA